MKAAKGIDGGVEDACAHVVGGVCVDGVPVDAVVVGGTTNPSHTPINHVHNCERDWSS